MGNRIEFDFIKVTKKPYGVIGLFIKTGITVLGVLA
jgi:hypothetical protein